MRLSKTGRWVSRSAKGFEPFSCYRGFTRQKGTLSGLAVVLSLSGNFGRGLADAAQLVVTGIGAERAGEAHVAGR